MRCCRFQIHQWWIQSEERFKDLQQVWPQFTNICAREQRHRDCFLLTRQPLWAAILEWDGLTSRRIA